MDTVFQYDRPGMSEEAQIEFFDSVLERTREAEQRSGRVQSWLNLAGIQIELAFAGKSLIPHILPALAHLQAEPKDEPDLRVHVWDSDSTGVEFVPSPVTRDCFTNRGDLWGMSSSRIRSAFQWIEFSVNVLDVERRVGVFWVRSAASVRNWTPGSPLRTLLHWCVEGRGLQLVHGAAVGSDEGAVLITGRGGIGKSTTALACLEAGMQYVGDDYVIVGLDPEPRVYSLYCAAKLAPEQLQRFPGLAALVGPDEFLFDGKALIHVYPHLKERLSWSLPLRAVIKPTFSGTEDTWFGPADRIELQQAAAITTMSQLPHADPRTHAFFERMVHAVPVGQLYLGTAIDRIPGAIESLVRGAADSMAPAEPAPDLERRRPLVSVVVPVYNGAPFIDQAVRSIVAQGYDALEIIVVDDGSTDDTAQVVARLGESIRYLSQENAGPAAARNRGIRDASGELIAFLDADDLWTPGSLQRLVDRLLEEPEVDVVHGHAQLFKEDGPNGRVDFMNPQDVFPYYIGAGVYRRRAFERAGLFEERLRFSEDTEWYGRAAESGVRIERVEDVVLMVRRHASNMTRGKTMADLELLRVLKLRLDRRRAGVPDE